MTGFDSSAGMLEQARGGRVPTRNLRMAELGSPLPFPHSAFGDVIAALVLHYLEDRGPGTGDRRWPSCGACSNPAVG
jgi:hypothetical protein